MAMSSISSHVNNLVGVSHDVPYIPKQFDMDQRRNAVESLCFIYKHAEDITAHAYPAFCPTAGVSTVGYTPLLVSIFQHW